MRRQNAAHQVHGVKRFDNINLGIGSNPSQGDQNVVHLRRRHMNPTTCAQVRWIRLKPGFSPDPELCRM